MNDLEPWTIWAVTGALVCAILLGTAARIRPIGAADSKAQASTLALDQQVPFIAPDRSQSPEQFDAYSYCIPHRLFAGVEYSRVQASTIVPLDCLLYGSAATADQVDESSRAEALDVARQILGSNSRDDLPVEADANANSDENRATLDITGMVHNGPGPAIPRWVFPRTTDLYETANDLCGEVLQFLGQSLLDKSDIETFNLVSDSPVVFVGDSGRIEVEGVSFQLSNGVVGSLSRMYLQAADTGPVSNPDVGQADGQDPVFIVKTTLRSESAIDLQVVDESRAQAYKTTVIQLTEMANTSNIGKPSLTYYDSPQE